MEPPQAVDSPALVSRTTRLEPPDFHAAFEALPEPKTVWSAPDEATVVGGGVAAALTADGADRFEEIRESASALFAAGDVHAGAEVARPRLFGGFAFHDGNDGGDPWSAFPGARFVLPRTQVTEADDGTWLTVNAVGPDASPEFVEERLEVECDRLSGLETDRDRASRPGITGQRRTATRDEWQESVETAVDRIQAGQLEKVVLSQALAVELGDPLPIAETLERLDEKYPDCHLFLVEPADDDTAFFGATPERLLSVRGRTVETAALAGTTGRGETPAEDEWLTNELHADGKNVHEHELVSDTICDQLEPFAASITTDERRIRRLATVQHLETPITADMASDEHVLTLVEALHPTPAVGGLPPGTALDTIRDTEPFDRGWYAAPVGWIDAAGNGTFAVALRSAVGTRDTATLFAGVGLVSDSDPDREWEEVQLKYRSILDELERDESSRY